MPACWSGCVVVPGSTGVPAQFVPATTCRQAFQYRPITCQFVGPVTGARTAFSQISSSPKTIRVGLCVTGSVAVGSTAIQLLYQDWIPGP
jgi:hypothetical protein